MVDIVNIVNVSTASQGRKLGFYNVNNIMLLSDETPIVDFGSDTYRAYVTANDVKTDFGAESKTYKIALKVFSQSPNILAGNGQLLIAPMIKEEIQAVSATGSVEFVSNPTEGNVITVGETTYTFSSVEGDTNIVIGGTLTETLENLNQKTFTQASFEIEGNKVNFTAVVSGTAGNTIELSCDVADAIVSGATLTGGAEAGEDVEQLGTAISRLYEKVYFGGVITSKYVETNEGYSASETVQSLDCLLILPSSNVEDLEQNGLFNQIINAGLTKTKCVLYTLGEAEAYEMAGAYAGRGFATNYNAEKSCITMNLKDLAGITADTGISQTIYNKAKELGVDLYTDIEGLPKVISNSGLVGQYFDQLINRLWFTQTVKVEVFNTLAGTNSKIPQTETGMNSIKNTIKKVADKAVLNGFLGAGTWNSADTFGNQEDFLRNISEVGYYIYSQPVSNQTQTERETRKAPVFQFAGKEQGAIHSADLILNFEA